MAEVPFHLAGTWKKDHELSETMDEIVEAMKINFIVKKAIRFINGVEIDMHEKGSRMVVTSSIPGLKIVEKYEWGVPTTLPRRDMRKGSVTILVTLDAEKKGLKVDSSWGEPYPGSLVEYIYCPNDDDCDLLYQDTTNHIGGKVISYRTVYHRKK